MYIHPKQIEHIVSNIKSNLLNVKDLVKEYADKQEVIPLPAQDANCKLIGVDGSRMSMRCVGGVIYQLSGVSVEGDPGGVVKKWSELKIINDFRTTKSREKIRTQMEILENRLALLAHNYTDDIILMDGSLSNALIKPYSTPKLFDFLDYDDIAKCRNEERLVKITDNFLELLEDYWLNFKSEWENENLILPENSLLSSDWKFLVRNNVLSKEEYKRAESFLEWVEYLHSIDLLLDKNLCYIAKSFYNNAVVKEDWTTDRVVFERLINTGYAPIEYGRLDKYWRGLSSVINSLEGYLKNYKKAKKDINIIKPCYVRFSDQSPLYLLESNIDLKKVMPVLVKYCGDIGYPTVLIAAHNLTMITNSEFRDNVKIILNQLTPEEFFILNTGREVLDGY